MFFKYILNIYPEHISRTYILNMCFNIHFKFVGVTMTDEKKSTGGNIDVFSQSSGRIKDVKIEKIFSDVLSSVVSGRDSEKEVIGKAEKILSALRKSAEKAGYIVSIELGGSAAKKTFLRQDFDCDVFVRFDYDKYSEHDSELSSYLKKIILDAGFSPVELHGSRNYFQFIADDLKFELVPVLWLKSIHEIKHAKNVTDASPFHVYWFNKKCDLSARIPEKSSQDPSVIGDTNPDIYRLNNQVRLTKIFSKAQRVYGAESYIQGFSGHVLDILIVHFGNFYNLADFFAKQDEMLDLKKYDPKKIVIDVEGFYHGKDSLEVQKLLNPSKIDSPIIIIDPISKDRNASSSIGLDKFNKFIRACRRFIDAPDGSLFKKIQISGSNLKDNILKKRILELKKRGLESYCIICKVEPKSGKKDIVGAKIKKVAEYIAQKLTSNSFEVYDFDFELIKKDVPEKVVVNDSEDFSESFIWFFVDKSRLEKEYLWAGPPKKEKVHAESFMEKHKSAVELDGRLYAKISREHTDAYEFVKTIVDDANISGRCKSISFDKFDST